MQFGNFTPLFFAKCGTSHQLAVGCPLHTMSKLIFQVFLGIRIWTLTEPFLLFWIIILTILLKPFFCWLWFVQNDKRNTFIVSDTELHHSAAPSNTQNITYNTNKKPHTLTLIMHSRMTWFRSHVAPSWCWLSNWDDILYKG